MKFFTSKYVRLALLTIVVLAFLFQLGHFFEHILQVYVWTFVDHYRIYMSPIAMAFERWFGNEFFSHLPVDLQIRIGKEFLHLGGDVIFLTGLIACNLLFGFAIRQGRWALGIQSFHTYEHISLATTIVIFHKPIGLSTLFGLAVPQPVYVGYLLWWHFFFNLIPMILIGYAIRQAHKKGGADPTSFLGRTLTVFDRLSERVGTIMKRVPYRKTLLLTVLLVLIAFPAISGYVRYAELQKLPLPERIVKECASYEVNERSLCYQLRIRHLYSDTAVHSNFEVIREVQAIDSTYSHAACSKLAYAIGQDVLIRKPDSLAAAAGRIAPDGLCANGYLQGLIDGAFGSRASADEFADVTKQLIGVCESSAAVSSNKERGACYEALGHALAMTPADEAIDVAPFCAVLADGKKLAEAACLAGIQAAEHSMPESGMMH